LFVIFIIDDDFYSTIAVMVILNENDIKLNHDLHQIFIWNTRRTIQFWFDFWLLRWPV